MQDLAEKRLSAGEGCRTVLVVCVTFRDHRELPRLGRPGLNFLFHDCASTSLEELICGRGEALDAAADPVAEIARIRAAIGDRDIAAIVSTDDYPGAALAAVLAEELGLPGPDPKASLICQSKYLSRLAQSRIVPDGIPPFWPIDVAEHAALPHGLTFPAFVKPMKSFFSIGAQRIEDAAELAEVKRKWAELDAFFMPLDRLLRRHADTEIGTTRLIAEGLLKGVQVTVEGYVHGGEVHILGVVDSILFPGTLFFSRFDYPSALPEGVQGRMAGIAERLMSGLDFDNGMFNVEMMYDAHEDRIAIIEINPRMASQFADLYEKVNGTNSYEVLLDLGCGVRPSPKRRQGKYRFAASCVLRTFEDGRGTSLRGKTRRDRTRLSRHQGRGPRHVWAKTLRRASGRDELSLRHRQSRRPRSGGGASTIRGVPSRAWHRPVAGGGKARNCRAGAVCSSRDRRRSSSA